MHFIKPVLFLLVIFIIPLLHSEEGNFYETFKQAAMSSAAGTPWNAARQVKLVEQANTMEQSLVDPSLKKTYPISEEDLQTLYNERQTLPFFAYSSMIDKGAGAVKAISPEAAATQVPAIAFGIQRTFNRELPAATVEGGYGALKRPNDLAILNAFPKRDAVPNGVVFDLPISDLMVLAKREAGYDLIPVLAMRWSDAIDDQKEPEIFLAYTFMAPDFKGEETRFTNDQVNPIPGYVNFLQNGLNAMGEDFKALWWNTTYLADKKTLINELPYQVIDLKKTDLPEAKE